MKTSWSAMGFLAVAGLIGLLEWFSQETSERQELLVTEAQRAFVRGQMLEASGSMPDTDHFERAMANYIDEEILYREGMKLGLDKDDLIVKRRVVQKMRFLMEDMTPLAPPDNAQLEAWLAQNPDRYQTGQSVSMEHHFFSRGKRADQAVYDAEAALSALRQGTGVQSDPFPLPAQVKHLTQEQATREFGLPAARALFNLQAGEWSSPVQSALGVHLFLVHQREPGRLMNVSEAGSQLRSDLLAAQRKEVNDAALAAIRSTYNIREVR